MASNGGLLAVTTECFFRNKDAVCDVAKRIAKAHNERAVSPVAGLQTLALTKVLLSEQQLDSSIGVELFPVLVLPAVAESLVTLDLSFNALDDVLWVHWVSRLREVKWPALTTLNLADNHFTSQTIKDLATFVERCPRLAHLDVSLNPLARHGAGKVSLDTIQPLVDALEAKTRQYLRVADLSCTELPGSRISKILVSAKWVKHLVKLYLRSNELGDEVAMALAQVLPEMALEVLSLAGNNIGDRGAASLAFVLDQTPALQTLDLEENQIGQAGIASFFHAINGMVAPFSLRYLHLARNSYASEVALDQVHSTLHEKIIETHLTAGSLTPTESKSVLKLNGSRVKRDILLECHITDRYVRAVMRTLRASPRWQLLEVLDLSGNEIGEQGAHEIGLFLALQPKLRALNLSNNLITDSSIIGLAEGLEPNFELQDLDLNHNQITDTGAKRLYLKAFTSNLQRRVLLNKGNLLTSECKVMLTAISQAHDLRKRFVKEFADEERLDLSGRALRQYGAAAIAEKLVDTPSARCRYLDFSRNGLGDEGAQAVAQLLRTYSRLEELDISFNDIGDDGAVAISEALEVNSTLGSFALHSAIEGSQAKSKLREKGLCQLAHVMQKHKALQKVDLRNNFTSPAVVRAYTEMLRGNPSIQRFNGSNAAVFLSRNEL